MDNFFYKDVTAADLKPGDVIQFNTRKNGKRYLIHKMKDAIEEIGQPPEKWHPNTVNLPDYGKLLIMLQNCRQLVLEKSERVVLIQTTD